MPKYKRTSPKPSREKGQRQISAQDSFFSRYVPSWLRPNWLVADAWRNFVLTQPVAQNCKDTLIASVSSLDWKIEPKDSKQRDELKSEIDYYTDLLDHGSNSNFTNLIELIGEDYLDLPFGAGVEIIRSPDTWDGRTVFLEPIDGGTLFPTLNAEWPVGQQLKTDVMNTIYFPYYAIGRVLMSPRSRIDRKGWGMPPPEKIYLAMELLNRGDKYYASLLLDTPQAGLLDLMDMDKESATEWIKAFQELMLGIDPFKIPVLYEHESDVKFIPFGQAPNAISFGAITLKYAALTCAGYNVSLSDIGLGLSGNGGETLAGSIRQERKTKRTGFARIKRKLNYFFNQALPMELSFTWIDPDEELGVALGRSRLASITALNLAVEKHIITPKEARLQLQADGLMSISMAEEIDESEFEGLMNAQTAQRPGMLGNAVPVSGGGQGEVKKSIFDQEIDLGVHRMLEALELRSEEFEFLPDVNTITDELVDLISDDPEKKVKLCNWLKNTVPTRFAESYSKILPYVELGDGESVEKVTAEIGDLRYNLADDFAGNIIAEMDGNNNVETKKTKRRRSNKNG